MRTAGPSAARAVAMILSTCSVSSTRRYLTTALPDSANANANSAAYFALEPSNRTTLVLLDKSPNASQSKRPDAQDVDRALGSRKKLKEKEKRRKRQSYKPSKDDVKRKESGREGTKNGEAGKEKQYVKESTKIRPGQSTLSIVPRSEQKRSKETDGRGLHDGKKK